MTNPPTFAEQLEQAADAERSDFEYQSFKAGAAWALESPLVKELEAALALADVRLRQNKHDTYCTAREMDDEAYCNCDRLVAREALAALSKAREEAE